MRSYRKFLSPIVRSFFSLLTLLLLLPNGLTAATKRIVQIEINTSSITSKMRPAIEEVLTFSRWKAKKTRSLLQDNIPFVMRVPVDSVLYGDNERIFSIASEATFWFYKADGSTVPVRNIGTPHPRANDKLSIKLSKADGINGYFLAYVQPRKAWVPSAQPFTRRGLRLLSTPIIEYDIVGTHFNLTWLRSNEMSMFFLLGGLFMLGCYFGMLYFNNRDEYIFGIYSAYLFFNSIYWAERIVSISLPFFVRSVDQIIVNTVSQICFHVAFTLLAHELLNFREHYPKLGKIWRLFAIAQLIFAAMFTVSIYAGINPVLLLNAFAVERCFIGIVALLTTLYFVIKPHNIYCYFLGFATFSFVGSALIALFVGDIKYFAVGLAVEILTFAFAIGHKIRKADESRIESEKSAFMLEREVIRTKDAALRAQMNPHFISNVINALRALILEGENKQAYSYLSRFAHVVRTMLGSADKQLIPLSEELRLLKDYVALEELRFGRSVHFKCIVQDGIDEDGILIPPMLLQPLVENAVHHGLFPLVAREPKITLTISSNPKDNTLTTSVLDNGIGREKAERTQLKRNRRRPSMALNIIRQRILLLYEGLNIEIKDLKKDVIHIQDLVDEYGEGIGTKISIDIPKSTLRDQRIGSSKHNPQFTFSNFMSRQEKQANV